MMSNMARVLPVGWATVESAPVNVKRDCACYPVVVGECFLGMSYIQGAVRSREAEALPLRILASWGFETWDQAANVECPSRTAEFSAPPWTLNVDEVWLRWAKYSLAELVSPRDVIPAARRTESGKTGKYSGAESTNGTHRFGEVTRPRCGRPRAPADKFDPSPEVTNSEVSKSQAGKRNKWPEWLGTVWAGKLYPVATLF